MIDAYTWPTPNGHKVHIMLEEVGLKYNVHGVNIRDGAQFKSEFLKISPNNRIPAIVDSEGPGGKGGSVFETGAILVDAINARPAVQRGLQVLKEVQAANQQPHDAKSWDIMFGKTQFQRR